MLLYHFQALYSIAGINLCLNTQKFQIGRNQFGIKLCDLIKIL